MPEECKHVKTRLGLWGETVDIWIFNIQISLCWNIAIFKPFSGQGEERPSEKGEKQLELGPMAGESKLIVPNFQILVFLFKLF